MTRVKFLENLLRVAVYEKELLELEKKALEEKLEKLQSNSRSAS